MLFYPPLAKPKPWLGMPHGITADLIVCDVEELRNVVRIDYLFGSNKDAEPSSEPIDEPQASALIAASEQTSSDTMVLVILASANRETRGAGTAGGDNMLSG